MTARHCARGASIALAAALLALKPSSSLAQVGHDPSHSPFLDLGTRQHVSILVGRFAGNRTKTGIGAQPATALGFRFRNRLSGPFDLIVGTTFISSKRIVIDPTQPDSIRRTGPVDYGLVSVDVGMAFSLTGAKTWHGFAPWIGLGFGVVTPTQPKTDPGGYRAGVNFTFAPMIGTSFHFSRQLGLELELRDNTMRYEWPERYFNPRDASGNPLPPPVLGPTERLSQLTHNVTFSAGLSYHFSF